MSATRQLRVSGPAGELILHVQGDENGSPVLMAHSILSSSMMWTGQADLLADQGFRVIRADTRGHGESTATEPPWTMDDLAADSVAILDALNIERAHYVGLSLGGMSGFGLGINHANRLLSLCLCDARADAPPAFAAPWDERIATARSQSCAALAQPTIERWFGRPFLEARPEIAQAFAKAAGATSVNGFVGCARAIQHLAYLPDVSRINAPTTLVVGCNDGLLPQAMHELQTKIPGAVLEVIADAGHLPNIDQPQRFNAALLRHFARVASRT